jgi:endonuclease/exonuclease/phosphatase family metal-dependent hydrolase
VRRSVAAVFTALLALTAALAGPGQGGPVTLRVVCYNIHHGEGTDRKLDLERVAGVLKAQRPDLVALQEVDRKARRTGQVDQAAKLGELTGLHAAFGRAMDHDGGGYGNAVLSRWPILSSESHGLPFAPGHEPRAVLEARVRVGADGPELAFLSTHLDHRSDEIRQRQADRIAELFANATVPTVLAGDLNARPGSPPYQVLARQWADATAGRALLTSPAAVPRAQIDYVLYRPAERFRVIDAKVVEEKVASDHRPVLVALEFRPD